MSDYGFPVLVLFQWLLLSNIPHVQGASIVKERAAPIADIALIIDQSGSIGSDHYEEEIDFAQQFAASFPIATDRTRFALVEFSIPNATRVRLDWEHGGDPHVVHDSLESMRHAHLGTGTDFAKALTVALERLQTAEAGDRPEAPNVAVMITDGYLNSRFERAPAFEAAHRLRSTGTLLYAIHVKLDPKLLRAPIEDLVEMTGNRSRVFAVEDFKRLTDEVLKHITQQITEEYQDCVYDYEPIGLCYTTPGSIDCIQDASLKVIRQPQAPYGAPCPTADTMQIPCSLGSCQDSCEQWPWGPWDECTSETCGQNGTKSRERHGQPPYPKLTTTCLLVESRACSQKELDALRCPDGGTADKVKAAGLGGGSKLPVWGIILVALICLIVLAIVITGVILYRSPRWRMVFVPTKPRKNQLPGNKSSDSASTASL